MKSKNTLLLVLVLCLVATTSYVVVDLLEGNQSPTHKDVAQIEENEEDTEKENPQQAPQQEPEAEQEPVQQPEQQPEQQEQTEVIEDEEAAPSVTVRSLEKMHEKIHVMANSLIIAENDEIWGEEPITETEVTKLITEVMASNYPDKDKLIEILNRWQAGDFSKGDIDHNYVWEKLEGDVGKAIGVKPEFRETQPEN